MIKKIVVTYDGEYPNMCGGTLIIRINGEVVYEGAVRVYNLACRKYDYYDGTIGIGKLIWTDKRRMNYSREVRLAVQKELDKYEVCCGGCE